MPDRNTVNVTMPSGKIAHVAVDETLANLLSSEPNPPDNPIVAAIVNNEVLDLSRRIRINATLRPIHLDSEAGVRCYRQSLCFVLAIAGRSVFPDRRLMIGHSLGDAYFYRFADDHDVTDDELEQLGAEMRR
ncbi:MAG: nucleoside kinase, partial [Spirochaetaceae bacterium]|nr:nucleoside kinase [Spirochaetaceae bacterium]